MTSTDDTCPACGFAEGTTYEAKDGLFRIWWPHCSHSTKPHPDLDFARLEWRKRAEPDR